MERLFTYSVVSSGEIKAGFELLKVQSDFADLFNITLEKAQTILSKKRALKKDLDLDTARAYVARLESIGVEVTVIEQKPEPSPMTTKLALEPTEEELRAAETTESAPQAAVDPHRIICPKCGLEQSKAEQCVGCGVYIHKVKNRLDDTPAKDPAADSPEPDVVEEASAGEALNLKALGAAAGAALIGAVVWNIVAMTTNYEFSIIAWGIGGAVGLAAAALGARGFSTGVICGVLAFVAIFGGKYLVIQSFKANWYEILMESGEFEDADLKQAYQSTLLAAQAYQSEVTDTASQNQFMVDYGYSEAGQASRVSAEEIRVFKDVDEPILLSMAAGNLSYEQWIRSLFKEDFENASTFDLLKEDFGIIDILFIFLGVGTAYRLGSGFQRTA